MVGVLGYDVLGQRYGEVLSGLNIGARGVAHVRDSSTGTASIEVTAAGENHIVVVTDANDTVTPAYIETQRSLIEGFS